MAMSAVSSAEDPVREARIDLAAAHRAVADRCVMRGLKLGALAHQ